MIKNDQPSLSHISPTDPLFFLNDIFLFILNL